MRIIRIMFVGLGFVTGCSLLMSSSCNPQYTCGRRCNLFNNGIQVCQASSADSTAFTKTTDSLFQLYGNFTPVLYDSVTVSGSSTNAVNSIVNQLERQGYTCTPD